MQAYNYLSETKHWTLWTVSAKQTLLETDFFFKKVKNLYFILSKYQLEIFNEDPQMLFPNSTCTQHLSIVPSDQQTLRKLLARYLWVY